MLARLHRDASAQKPQRVASFCPQASVCELRSKKNHGKTEKHQTWTEIGGRAASHRLRKTRVNILIV